MCLSPLRELLYDLPYIVIILGLAFEYFRMCRKLKRYQNKASSQ